MAIPNQKALLRRQLARALWRSDYPKLPGKERASHWQSNRTDYVKRADVLIKAMVSENIAISLIEQPAESADGA